MDGFAAPEFLNMMDAFQEVTQKKKHITDVVKLSNEGRTLIRMEPMDRLTYAVLTLADAMHRVGDGIYHLGFNGPSGEHGALESLVMTFDKMVEAIHCTNCAEPISAVAEAISNIDIPEGTAK